MKARVLANDLTRANARELLSLEKRELQRVRQALVQARRDLLLKLSEVRVDTFTAQRLRWVQVQVDAALRETRRLLREIAEDQVDKLLETGISQTLAEIAGHHGQFGAGAAQRIRVAAVARTTKPKALLLDQYRASIDAYTLGCRREMAARIGVALARNAPWQELVTDLAGKDPQSALAGNVWRAERIVRTEMVEVLNTGHQAGLEGAAELLPGLLRQWDAHLDERTSDICHELNGRVREMDKPFGSYRGRPVMRPPVIANCRSRLVPWHADWTDQERAARAKE